METKRKPPATSITSFFSPVPKPTAQEERSVSADDNTHDSMGHETWSPRPETTSIILTSTSSRIRVHKLSAWRKPKEQCECLPQHCPLQEEISCMCQSVARHLS